jgi:hypothetical protein
MEDRTRRIVVGFVFAAGSMPGGCNGMPMPGDGSTGTAAQLT